MSDWFRCGFGWLEEKVKRENASVIYPPRVVFPKGEKKRLLFLDGDGDTSPFWVVEHRKKVNGNWVYPVCQNSDIYLGEAIGRRRRAEMNECYMCDHGKNRYVVGLMTVIDVGGYVKEGLVRKGTRMLYAVNDDDFVAKGLLAAKEQCGGSLVGAVIEITEMQADWGGCGTHFDVIDRVAPERWEKAQAHLGCDVGRYPWVPFDYLAFTKMMTNDIMKSLVLGEVIPDSFSDGEVIY